MKYKDWSDWTVQRLVSPNAPFEKRTYVTHKPTNTTAWELGHHNLSAEYARERVEWELKNHINDWKTATDFAGRTYRERDDAYREYQLDLEIAKRIKELHLGLNGCKRHSARALAIAVTGYECQITGQDLVKLAEWTLGEECK